jgi:hypothetical protein
MCDLRNIKSLRQENISIDEPISDWRLSQIWSPAIQEIGAGH